MDAARLMSLVRPMLAEAKASWMLAGGFAMAAWGSTRTTVDLDLVVDESARADLVAMKLTAITNQPARVFCDGEDLRLLLSLPGVDESVVHQSFERSGLLELYHRLTSKT
jgi:hypothetical protein